MSPVSTRLEQIESKEPLVFDAIDFDIRNPARLASKMAAPLQYAQRVEQLVGITHMATLMPRRPPEIDRFLAAWTDDELSHARALAHLLKLIGLDTVSIDGATPPGHNATISRLGRASNGLHGVVEMVWATSGAMNEHLAMAAYSRIDDVLQHDGELALHHTLFRRLRAHESAHKSFYSSYAAERWVSLKSWQRRLARATIRRTWAPVGATEPEDRPPFARTVATLAPDDWHTSLVRPVQSIADRLMEASATLGPFVEHAVILTLQSDPTGEDLLAAL